MRCLGHTSLWRPLFTTVLHGIKKNTEFGRQSRANDLAVLSGIFLSLKHGNLLINRVESHRASWFIWKERHISLIHIQKHHPHYVETVPWAGPALRGLRAKHSLCHHLETNWLMLFPTLPGATGQLGCLSAREACGHQICECTLEGGLGATRRWMWSKVRNAKFYVLGVKKEAESDSGFCCGDPVSQRLTKSPFWIVYRITWKSPSQNASSDCRDRNRNSFCLAFLK